MIENVTVIGPHTGVVGIEGNFDCRFWRNQDGVAFCAGNFLPVDFGNSSTIGFVWSITDDCQVNPAIYVTNDSPHEVLGYVSFTYTFHVWGGRK
jgi:hypothetical protein